MDKENRLRLDILLSKKVNGLTRSQANRLIDTGKVSVDNKVITKPSAKFNIDAKLKVASGSSAKKIGVDIPVIYEDESVLVINKPIGLLAHSKGSFNEEETIAEWLASKLGVVAKTNRDGIVHRLDRSTSGVMILAKNEEAKRWLSKQFSTRKVLKKYIAVTTGVFETKEALIDMPIIRNPKRPQTFKTDINGKPSTTKYKVLKEINDFTMLELTPETGRTHQLRVHLAAIGHPILGDTLYGGTTSDRIYLHAKSLEITLPSKIRKIFTARMPKEFDEIMK